MALEMLELGHGVTGLALNLESDNVGAVLFGPWEKIVEGDTVKRTNRLLEIPVGKELLGRIVSPLGQPLDGKGEINTETTRPAEFKAPGVVQRQPVKEPMQTGRKIELSASVEPEILGGLVVRVGNSILDASIRNRLEQLRKQVARA
jgi:F-type H+-transporting ATPase subunit alpha